MAKYIEREALRLAIFNTHWKSFDDVDTAYDIVDSVPAADVVEVVRCKDCKHRHSSEFCECRPEDGFCNDGERRDSDG